MAGSHEVRGSIPLCSTKFSQASGIVAGLFPFKTDFQPTVTDPQVLGSDGAVALAVATATHLARLIKLTLLVYSPIRRAKSASASGMSICWGQTCVQAPQPMQALGCLSAGMAPSAIGAMNAKFGRERCSL